MGDNQVHYIKARFSASSKRAFTYAMEEDPAGLVENAFIFVQSGKANTIKKVLFAGIADGPPDFECKQAWRQNPESEEPPFTPEEDPAPDQAAMPLDEAPENAPSPAETAPTAAEAAPGHNQPPKDERPLHPKLEPHREVIEEARNWLDGTDVTTDGQLEAVDKLIAMAKDAKKAVDDAREKECKPLHKTWKDAVAEWKKPQDEIASISAGLVEIAGKYRKAKADAQREAEKQARIKEAQARERAKDAALLADPKDAGSTTAAIDAKAEMEQARAVRQQVASQKVKGLRKVQKHEVLDRPTLFQWILANDERAIDEFVDAYAARHFKEKKMAGVRTWEDEVPY